MSVKSEISSSFSDRELPARILAEGIPGDYRPIYSGRNRVAVSPDGSLCLKSFAVPGFFKALWYSVFPSKASRAYHNALMLKEKGIGTPEPYFYIERHGVPGLRESYYACECLRGYNDLRGVQDRADFPEIAEALAAFISRLHEKEVWMKDLTMGNVLFVKENGVYCFSLVDINRMSFAPRRLHDKLDDFGSLLETEGAVEAVAREYVALNQLDEDLVSSITDRYRSRQKALWRRRHIKEFLRGKRS